MGTRCGQAQGRAPTPHFIREPSIVDDMGWYGERISFDKHDVLPKLNTWSYMQILWHITKIAERSVSDMSTEVLHQQIDYGKKHVGKVVEIFELFSTSAA